MFTFQPVQHSPVQSSAAFVVEGLQFLSKAHGVRNKKLTQEWKGNSHNNWNKTVGVTFLTSTSGRHGKFIVHPYILTDSEQHQDDTTQSFLPTLSTNSIISGVVVRLRKWSIIDLFISLIFRINCAILMCLPIWHHKEECLVRNIKEHCPDIYVRNI